MVDLVFINGPSLSRTLHYHLQRNNNILSFLLLSPSRPLLLLPSSMATISPGGAYIGTPTPFLGKKLKPFSLNQTISTSKPTVNKLCRSHLNLIDAVHNLFLGVGVGLPCTVMECGDMIYRSTLPKSDGLTITAPGVALALTALSYLWATPGVAPGFFDMFVLAFVERLFRPTFRKVGVGSLIGLGPGPLVFCVRFHLMGIRVFFFAG